VCAYVAAGNGSDRSGGGEIDHRGRLLETLLRHPLMEHDLQHQHPARGRRLIITVRLTLNRSWESRNSGLVS